MAERNDPTGEFRASDAAWSRLAALQSELDSYDGDHAGRADILAAMNEVIRKHGQPPA